jgi:hypothetical protein
VRVSTGWGHRCGLSPLGKRAWHSGRCSDDEFREIGAAEFRVNVLGKGIAQLTLDDGSMWQLRNGRGWVALLAGMHWRACQAVAGVGVG